MRYGQPGIGEQLDLLKAEGATRVLVLPAYPQYSGTTTASVFDAFYRWGQKIRHMPEFRFVNRYHDDAGYIAALAARVRAHWQQHGQGEVLVMSFHGVPERTLHLGDPYHCHCMKTARLLAERMQLPREKLKVVFQSRFGKAEWLQPYAQQTVEELPAQGVKKLLMITPGFASDCVETLEEVAIGLKETFEEAGGDKFSVVPCLNDSEPSIEMLEALVRKELQGWA